MPIRILVVEDNPDSREILRLYLQSMGYEVIEAGDGEEALEKAQTKRPDLILMDLGLPKLTGLEAARRLRENESTAAIPVVAHTAWGKEQYEEEARAAGIRECLTKPVPARVLKELLNRILKKES